MNHLIVAISGLFLCAAAQAQLSAYLPAAGQLAITPSYVYSTYDEFWMGNVKTDLGTRQSQHNGFITFEYGAFDHVAFDLTLGYTDGGGRYYSVFGVKNVDGKNTGDKWIAGASITIPFQVR